MKLRKWLRVNIHPDRLVKYCETNFLV